MMDYRSPWLYKKNHATKRQLSFGLHFLGTKIVTKIAHFQFTSDVLILPIVRFRNQMQQKEEKKGLTSTRTHLIN